MQDIAEQRRTADFQFLQNIKGHTLSIDFCPALAGRVRSGNLHRSVETIAVLCTEDNLISNVLDLPAQESYAQLQPDLVGYQRRHEQLLLHVRFSPLPGVPLPSY